MDTDNRLLEKYAHHGSEPAFRELVERHINLVYSAAVRESGGNPSVAEDITQAVFTELARSATNLLHHPALAGWLYTCVRRMTANVRRAEDRRQRREQKAFDMNQLLSSDPTDNLWREVWPVLDDVMHELEEEDRTLMVLRFFEGRNFREVGAALGLTENAARMRVERSLEKLRGLLSQRGVTSTASALAVVLTAGAATAAPSALASTVAAAAMTAVGTGASGASALTKLFSLTKTQFVAGTLLLGMAGLIAWDQVRSRSSANESVQQAQAAVLDSSAAAVAAAAEHNGTVDPAERTFIGSSQMMLRLVEAETGKPLPHAKLYLAYFRENGRNERVRLVADADGTMAVDIFERPFRGLNLFVTADGHVPKVTSFGYGREMPPEYTMKMEQGVTIGGVVVDESAQPIAGAKIEVGGPGNDSALPDNIQFGPDAGLQTDADGRWSCNMLPRDLRRLSLLLAHPDYADTTAPVQPEAAQAHRIVMKPGFTVGGVVRDGSGNAIPGAEVRDVRLNEEGEHTRTTDGSGTFEFKNIRSGELLLAVKANGFAPAVQTLQVTGAIAGVEFQLGPGQLLRGRVVDEDSNPVGEAWAGTTPGRRKIQWSTKTDSDGRFQWDSAPVEPLLYSFKADGFDQAYALSLSADGTEHEIKLSRGQRDKETIRISGTVIDAATERPLNEFTVLLGEVSPDWPAAFRFADVGINGKFTLSRPTTVQRLSTGDPESKNRWYPAVYQLEIRKDGYVPLLSSNIFARDGAQTFTFRLQNGSGPSGLVLLPDGQPAADATVLLCTSEKGVTIDGLARVEKRYSTKHHTQTDEAGRFSLPAVAASQGLVAVHDQGYAGVSVAAADKIILQPWGRLEGTLTLDAKPAANQRIGVRNQVRRYDEAGRSFGFVSYHFETKTDSDGRFTFDKVLPGTCNVYRELSCEPDAFLESHKSQVVVHGGATTEVVLGGGRTVTGRVVLAEANDPIEWPTVPVRLLLKTGNEPGLRPRRDDFSSKEAYMAATDYFFAAYGAQRQFATFCDNNGSFRLQDIPAGPYRLEITVRDPKRNSVVAADSWTGDLVSLAREVIVPDTGDGGNSEPVDLGTLRLQRSQNSASAK